MKKNYFEIIKLLLSIESIIKTFIEWWQRSKNWPPISFSRKLLELEIQQSRELIFVKRELYEQGRKENSAGSLTVRFYIQGKQIQIGAGDKYAEEDKTPGLKTITTEKSAKTLGKKKRETDIEHLELYLMTQEKNKNWKCMNRLYIII